MHIEVFSNGIKYTFTNQGFTADGATYRYSDILEFNRGQSGLKLATADEKGSVRYYKVQFPIDKIYAIAEIENLYFHRDSINYTITTPSSPSSGNDPGNAVTPTNNQANPSNQQLLSMIKDIREDVSFFKTLAIILLCLYGVGLLFTVITTLSALSGSSYY